MNSHQQTQATGYVARVAINLAALAVLAPLKGIEGGLRVVERGLDLASGACGSTANGVSWAAKKVSKASQFVEVKCKNLCNEVRDWQAAELGEEPPEAEVPDKSPVAADLASAGTKTQLGMAKKLAADAAEEAAEHGTSKEAAVTKVTAGSGIKVCDICNMPKKAVNYAKHRTLCTARYMDARNRAEALIAGGMAVNDACLRAAIKADIRYDGGRPEVVKKLIAALSVKEPAEEAGEGTAKETGASEGGQPTLKIVKPPSEDGGTPGSVLDPAPA